MYSLCSLYLLLNQWAETPQIFAGIPQIGCGKPIAKKILKKKFTEFYFG
jgi:hypothetical protein